MRLTHKEVFSLALRLAGNEQDAADIAQETYVKLLRAIRQFRGESKFSTWLYKVTSSVALTRLRKRARDANVLLEREQWHAFPAPASAGPERKAETRLLHERIDEALGELPEGYRAVVVMKDIYGFPLEYIGRELGISEGAAKVRLFRARQRLRQKLGDIAPGAEQGDQDAVS